jgi:uncharacterized membrane protein
LTISTQFSHGFSMLPCYSYASNERIDSMKRVLLTLLAVLFVLGLLGAAGYAGYRLGFQQGVLATSDGDRPFITPREFGFGMGPGRMPMHEFGFQRGFDQGGFGMMGSGYGFYPWFGLLTRLMFWGLIAWAIYMLVTRSGWRLTRTTPPSESQPPPSTVEKRE